MENLLSKYLVKEIKNLEKMLTNHLSERGHMNI